MSKVVIYYMNFNSIGLCIPDCFLSTSNIFLDSKFIVIIVFCMTHIKIYISIFSWTVGSYTDILCISQLPNNWDFNMFYLLLSGFSV